MAVSLSPIVTAFPDGVIPDWPEPIQRVQALADSGLITVPSQYVRPEWERPDLVETVDRNLELPVIDLSSLEDANRRRLTLAELEHACEEWGFFQILNHGIPLPLLQKVRMVAKQFFQLPAAEKQAYANNPGTYEGYGSRLGVEKGAILDWGDYFFVNIFPDCTRDSSKWPSKPTLWRETMEEYSEHVVKLCENLLAAISSSLQLSPTALKEAFSGNGKDGIALCMRVNFYPPCPQPELTLGLSAHSDPGGLTILLQDERTEGLQVRHDGMWVPVKVIPGSLVVNIADQIQILTNGRYKSVEHRAIVNRDKDRVSLAAFCNPANDVVISPMKELVREAKLSSYLSMSFREYRSFIRRQGTKGKEIIQALTSPSYKMCCEN
eukprot:c27062_g1_i1 orf=30-1169(-)